MIGYIAEWLNSFHVYAFTLISGYVYHFLSIENGSYQKYSTCMLNKAKRLLVPYVFIGVIWAMPVYFYFYGFDGIIQKFILGINPSQLWYLLMLFWVFAFFWWITDLSAQHPITGLAIVCVCYLFGKGLNSASIPDYFMFETGLQYMIFFYIGFMIRQFGSQFLMKIPSFVYITVDVCLFVLTLFIQDENSLAMKVVFLGVNLLLHMTGAIMAFVIMQRMVIGIGENRILAFFSKNSMAIYLVHQQLIYFTIKWFNGLVHSFALVIINFCFSLGISTVFAWLMSRSRITGFLIGSK